MLIIHDDCRTALPKLKDHSVDLVVTDPPYFIDGMDNDWDRTKLDQRRDHAGVIGSLPVGMKFDPAQGHAFQAFMTTVAAQCFRILKPGGFFVCFSQARLYHRLAVATESAGFEIRDMLVWQREGQAKAFSQDHFIRKQYESGKITRVQAERMITKLGGRKTPQLKPQMEPMVLAQKPREGTFLNNWLTWGVGLMDTTQTLDGKFPGTVMKVPKPNKVERGVGNTHLTVKPVTLIAHIIQLFTTPGQVVLDPFMGSGSHGVAALQTGRQFIGIELEQSYVDIAIGRMQTNGNGV